MPLSLGTGWNIITVWPVLQNLPEKSLKPARLQMKILRVNRIKPVQQRTTRQNNDKPLRARQGNHPGCPRDILESAKPESKTAWMQRKRHSSNESQP